MSRLFNSVLPSKVYGIFNGHKEIGEIVADNVGEAFRRGRLRLGARCGAAILKGLTQQNNGRSDPMFSAANMPDDCGRTT